MDASSDAAVAVRSSDALREASGRDRPEWFALLDEWGAGGREYRDIADWLTSQGLSAWWAQKLIVEYEQARDLRSPGVRRDGTFAGGASKTLHVPVARAFAAFADPQQRERWLPGVDLQQRTARPNRSARFECADGTRLTVDFAAKGDGKTLVAVEHVRLPDAAAVAEAKRVWRDRLTALKELLEG